MTPEERIKSYEAPAIDEIIVEKMARARCDAAGIDPDKETFSVWTSEGEVVWAFAWCAEVEPARKQLAAHRAMIEAQKETK